MKTNIAERMQFPDIVARICAMPLDFHRRGNVSMVRLLKESGYGQHRREITGAEILSYVQAHPEIVKAWQCYSDDQRCTPSWGFRDRTIEYITTSGRCQSKQEYPSENEACAAYVKRMAEEFRITWWKVLRKILGI